MLKLNIADRVRDHIQAHPEKWFHTEKDVPPSRNSVNEFLGELVLLDQNTLAYGVGCERHLDCTVLRSARVRTPPASFQFGDVDRVHILVPGDGARCQGS